MKKILLLLAMFIVFSPILKSMPDEGMWLPLYIKQMNEKQMIDLGCKLTAEDIYNINKASVKDAVLRLGSGFCTGELVSNQGLVFTNHHCGYEAIAELSSVTNNFLEDGFWAKSLEEEIPIPDFTVSRLVYMEFLNPIIEKLTAGITDEEEKAGKIQEITDSIMTAATTDNHYDAEIKIMFGDADYYLMVYETFKDVRFVGAPPSSVGKYGGDTDNWMWPRHTGDFSILRVYMGPDGKPAEYSTENIPYKPIHHFKVSLNGVERNDFAMIMGYPGTTERYLTSYDIDYKQNNEQPALIDIFGEMLSEMKKSMDADPEVKLELASSYASLANYYKYLEGQNLGLKKYGLVEQYQKQEKAIYAWMEKNPDMKEKYGYVLSDIEQAYDKLNRIMPSFYYVVVGAFRHEMFEYIQSIYSLNAKLDNGEKAENLTEDIEAIRKSADELFASNSFESNKELFKKYIYNWYANLDNWKNEEFLMNLNESYGNEKMSDNIDAFFEDLYSNSVAFNRAKLDKFLKKPKQGKLTNDLSIKLTDGLFTYLRNNRMAFASSTNQIYELTSDFIALLRDFKAGQDLYPDANSTLRMTYGSVTPYNSRDAVFYKYYTTHYGILEKYVPGDEEFDLDPKLIDLLENKDFGQYGKNDTLYVCFLTNNDITGGNSGSPVLNADGDLIGIAFDGNWEAMTGDLVVDPKLNRTINVDIRYVLFIIDKLGGAHNLIEELDFVVKENQEKSADIPKLEDVKK